MLVARSERPQSEIAMALREVIRRLDPDMPLYSVGGLDEAVAFVFVPAWAATIALNAFGILAVMLATTGIYGLAAYSVSRRTREISIRSAIGARPSQILRSVVGRTGVVLAVGSLAGILLGLGASRVLQHVVYQATPRDPIVLVSAIAVMCGLGVSAAWVPARRALRIDPVRALRGE
jgi:ABC-type antimicrobial peptide transport system permease subunit